MGKTFVKDLRSRVARAVGANIKIAGANSVLYITCRSANV